MPDIKSLAAMYNQIFDTKARAQFPMMADTDVPDEHTWQPPMDPSMGMGSGVMNQDFPGMVPPPSQSMADSAGEAPPAAPQPRPGSYFGRSGVPFGANRDFHGRMMPPNVPAMNVMPQPGAG